MKVLHGDPERTKRQKVYAETEDGKFRYQVDLDYAKGLPEQYSLVPVMGNVSGGCVDKDDNLYVGLRGGSFMNPEPRTCLIKLDPDGNYLESIGQDVLGSLHFFECTDHDTIVLVQTMESYAIEITMDGKKVVRTFGEKNNPCRNGRDADKAYNETRIHYGIFGTEPFSSYDLGGSYGAKLAFEAGEMGEGN